MLAAFLSIYLGLLLGIVLATLILIFSGLGWGPLPRFYVYLVEFIQSFYPHTYPTLNAPWPAILKRCEASGLEHHRNDSLSSFKFSSLPTGSPFAVSADAFKAGFEAIAQDDLSVAFDSAPPFYTTILDWPGRLPFPEAPCTILRRHIFGYFLSILFRYSILLPIRVSFIVCSFVFCSVAVTSALFVSFTKQQKSWISVTYCRLFCAGIGLVANYHNTQNRPKQPGVAVSNHLSPNDIQIIFAGADTSLDYTFTVTGQRHGGIIWAIERLVEKFCHSIWLDRADPNDRKRFTEEVMRDAQTEGPVLIFPEGYCTNNTRILRFRRAVFEDGVIIYPIAIRQNARFGDSFWSEDVFWRYLLRIITSWAIVYDVFYLEAMRRARDEPPQDFANRVQKQIARAIGAESLGFDGRLWYKKEEQERMKDVQMHNLAQRILALSESTQTDSPTDRSPSPLSHSPKSHYLYITPHNPTAAGRI